MTDPDPSPERLGYRPSETMETDFDFRDLLRRVWGYKWLIAFIVASGVGTTWLVVQQIVPRYTATAILLIEPPERNVIELRDVVEGLDRNPQTIRGEEVVIASRELAAKAVEKLGLFETRRFSSTRNRSSFLSHINPLTYIPADWKSGIREFWRDAVTSIRGETSSNSVTEHVPLLDDLESARRNRIINQFLSGLDVSRDEFTRVIRISFTFEDPKLAADATNALADTYVRNTLEVKYAGTREAAKWLGEQLVELRRKVEESEAEVERLRQGEALVRGRSSKVVAEQISAINHLLLAARADKARLRVRVQQIEELRDGPNGFEGGNSLLESKMIQTLRLEKFQLEREEADLALELGAKHPKLINVRAEIADISTKLNREFEMMVTATRNELAIAGQQEAAIRKSLNSMTNQVGGLNDVEVQLRAFEREAAANRSLYETFLTRSKETSVQEEVQQPDARVISYAQIPGAPSYPPKESYIRRALLLSIGVALGLVYLLEKLDKGFRTGRQVEQLSGLPVLGLVPVVKLRKENVGHPEDLIAKDRHTRFTEAINVLYSNLKWPRDGTRKKAILVSSAMPKEGKTATAIALAKRAAYLGDKVLLIDSDFRRPQATQHLGMKSSPGIAELIAESVALDECLQRDEASGAYFLSGGKIDEDPVALIGSDKFRGMLDDLRNDFDLIILDSSPILAVAETQILSRTVDQTLVLVRWGKTPRQVALTALKQLQDYGGRLAGVALTQVDVTKQSYYGYGEYGYYSSKMKGYYAE